VGVRLWEFESPSGHHTTWAVSDHTAGGDRAWKRALFTRLGKRENTACRLLAIYRALHDAFGPQGWWPSQSAFETVVGAVLTQRTSWRNAETALGRLRIAGVLSLSAMAALDDREIEELVRSSGFYRQKARTLRALVARMAERTDGFDGLMRLDGRALRDWLLETKGVGPETADAIVLYARGHPSFVVDTYTRRFAIRHSLIHERATYEELKSLFEQALPRSTELLSEFHALLVRLGKGHCRTVPRCRECPLLWDLARPTARPRRGSSRGGARPRPGPRRAGPGP
jgi:endonuclease-3 related protein